MIDRPQNLLSRRRRNGRSAGFTLVEMLVVLGIALLLMAIVLPALNRAYNQGVRTRMTADLQAIATALEAYRQDHGDFPRTDSANEGAIVLCRALIAPGPATGTGADGKDGPGFRTRQAVSGVAQGKAYGPYLDIDTFKIDDADIANPRILDRNGRPILYFPGFKNADVTVANGYIAGVGYGPVTLRPMFNANDNDMTLFDEHDQTKTAADGLSKFRYIMGCNPGTGGANGVNAANNGSPYVAAYTGPYLLWSAGPDEKFGMPRNEAPSPRNPCDDVANFQRGPY